METVRDRIDRARTYLADVRAGHVGNADEAAVIVTLTGHLASLLDVIDDQYIAYPAPEGEQARLRDELLAVVPAIQHKFAYTLAAATDLARHPGDTIQIVTDWLRATRRESGLTPEQLATVLDALEVAAEGKRDRAANCPDCEASPAALCSTCEWRLARAEEYDALAATVP